MGVGSANLGRSDLAVRTWSWNRRILTVMAAVVALAVAAGLGSTWWLHRQIEAIPRLEVLEAPAGIVPAPPAGPAPSVAPSTLALPKADTVRSFLLVSVGSANMSAQDGQAIGVTDVSSRGGDKLTDTILNVLVNERTGAVSVLSVPRDTWVPWCGCKINSLLRDRGPQALTEQVGRITGVPVNHVAMVNFAAFAQLTDALGGVQVQVTRPLSDEWAHLEPISPGCVRLDGKTALALMRSRHTLTRNSSGQWVADAGGSDFGRMARQQVFVRAVLSQLLTPSAVWQVPQLLGVAQGNVTLDETLTTAQLADLSMSLASAPDRSITTFSLPSTVGWVGQASVVFTDSAKAAGVLTSWRTNAGLPDATGAAATPAPRATATPAAAHSPAARPSTAPTSGPAAGGVDAAAELAGLSLCR